VDEPRNWETERRANPRFAVRQQLKYSLLENGAITTFGTGVTIDFSSGGVAFTTEHHLKPGSLIELRIDWPWVSGDTCPILLFACGRIVRSAADRAACTIAEFKFLVNAAAHRAVKAVSGDPKAQH
jgi:c-di-GMP-binding flagellar brake protein YcgR